MLTFDLNHRSESEPIGSIYIIFVLWDCVIHNLTICEVGIFRIPSFRCGAVGAIAVDTNRYDTNRLVVAYQCTQCSFLYAAKFKHRFMWFRHWKRNVKSKHKSKTQCKTQVEELFIIFKEEIIFIFFLYIFWIYFWKSISGWPPSSIYIFYIQDLLGMYDAGVPSINSDVTNGSGSSGTVFLEHRHYLKIRLCRVN